MGHAYDTGDNPGRIKCGLDVDGAGNQYMPGSLYMEARK
jgi:hypothetical protein